MRILVLALFSFITLNIAGQDSAAALKKFDQEMIHFYKRGYVKNGGFHTLSDLRLEMKAGLPSYDFFRQYKKNETNQRIASLVTIGGTLLYLSALNDNSGINGNEPLFWTGIITTAIATVFSFSFENKKIKFLTLAVKTRNREILAGTSK
jgi:hypothetical protein